MVRALMLHGITVTLATAAPMGCPSLVGLLPSDRTTVELRNDGDFAVEVTLFTAENQEIPRSLLTELGTRSDLRVEPGESTSFSRDCDELQAIVIDDADLILIGDVGPDADTDVLRDGSDFGCGDTITFTFDHSAALLDFDVSVSIAP